MNRTRKADSRHRSPGMQLEELAPLPVDILIEGETGVGKDVMAEQLHQLSGRPGAFVALNCAALPESLAEAELFGVEAGAYTGAAHSRAGRVEAAHRGTLYLDEIDSMPMPLQAKLLRVLQKRGNERLGSNRFVASDFRVIASTKAPLAQMVSEGCFRRDLYYRLDVVHLRIPALRHRPDELLALFRAAVAEFARSAQRPAPAVSPDTEILLVAHAWPGNIRELKAAAQRYVLGLPIIGNEALTLASGHPVESLREQLRWFERQIIERALSSCGSTSRASEALQVSLPTLYYRIRRLGIAQAEPGKS